MLETGRICAFSASVMVSSRVDGGEFNSLEDSSSMGRMKSASFFAAVFLLAFGTNAAAQGAQDESSITLLNGVGTAGQSAVLAAYVVSIDDGRAARTGMSVSNILGVPAGSGFPSGENETGSIWVYLFNSIGTVYVFHTSDHPDVGSGLDLDGKLAPGGTWTVNLFEILQALHPDRQPADRDFAGYAWIVADYDAVAGTYFNSFPLEGVSQAFQMQPTLGGIPVVVENGN